MLIESAPEIGHVDFDNWASKFVRSSNFSGGNVFFANPNIVDQGAGSGSLKDMVDSIGTTNQAVIVLQSKGNVETVYTVTTAETVPSNIVLRIETGAVFDGAGTLTINGPLDAGLYKIFGSSITVVFGEGVSNEYFPQWFGAPVNGSDNDLVACQRLADSMTSGTMRLTGGDWTFTTMASYTSANTGSENGQLIIANPISIKGDGRDHSIITSTLDDTYYGMIVVNGVNGVTIEDIALKGTGTAYSVNYGGGIRVLLSSRCVVKNCHFEDLRGIGVNFVGNAGLAAGDTDVNYYCTYGIVDGNIFRNINSDGIYHILSRENATINNVLYNCGNTDAIIYEASPHSTVANNIVKEPKQRGILINTGSSFCTITGNTIYHYDAATVYEAIYLASVRYCTVSNNTIEYATTGGTPTSAITSIPGLQTVVDTYHVIANNTIKNAGGSEDYTAIHIQTDYNLVEGNNIGGGTYGVSFDDADYNILKGNFIHSAGQDIRLVGIDARPDPTYTYVVGNYITTAVYDNSSTTHWERNLPGNLAAVAATTDVLNAYSKQYTSVTLDSTAGAITLTVGAGSYVGQTLTIVMIEASSSSTVSITNHQTSDPEVATFDAVDETGVFMWTGTEWITIFATCTFV